VTNEPDFKVNPEMKNRPRVLVVGLDGATLDLIEPWAACGVLPTFRRLLDEGAWGPLRTTIPPITGPAWTSFATGKNPGKHGLFDFLGRRPGSYKLVSFNATHRHGASLWGLLSQAGKKVGVLNVPLTYPPEPVNGFLITGLLTPPDARDHCYPTTILRELCQAVPGYVVQPAGNFDAYGREMELIRVAQGMTKMRMEAASYLMQTLDWDFFMVVFMATDILQHALWHLMDPTHAKHDATVVPALENAIQDCYKQIDGCLGEFLATIDEDTYLMIMSDHGFGPLEKYLHMNTWLWRQGFLKLKSKPFTWAKRTLFQAGITPLSVYRLLRRVRQAGSVAQTVRRRKEGVRRLLDRWFLSFEDVDWSQTRAYSVGNVGPIFVNLRGREPEGIVEPGEEYEEVLEELMQALCRSQDPATEQPMIETVYRRDEIYSGPHLDEAPDLFCIPRDLRYNAFGSLQFPSNMWLETTFDRTGGHRMDGMLVLKGPGVRPGHRLDSAKIVDLAPTILALMGVPILSDMDGQVLQDIFTDDFRASLETSLDLEVPREHHRPTELSAEDEEAVRERLKGLGYLG
jgi:predicted AlkP superfamily phosphohydrolase/phosphomutase